MNLARVQNSSTIGFLIVELLLQILNTLDYMCTPGFTILSYSMRCLPAERSTIIEMWSSLSELSHHSVQFCNHQFESSQTLASTSAKCILSLGSSSSVWEDLECKHRCVNFRRVSDPRRAFRPAFRGTGISDDWYRSTMGVIVISLGTPQSAGEYFGRTWVHQLQAWERRRQACEH